MYARGLFQVKICDEFYVWIIYVFCNIFTFFYFVFRLYIVECIIVFDEATVYVADHMSASREQTLSAK